MLFLSVHEEAIGGRSKVEVMEIFFQSKGRKKNQLKFTYLKVAYEALIH